MTDSTRVQVCSCPTPCHSGSYVSYKNMLARGVQDTVVLDVRKGGKVDWESVLDVKWGFAMDEHRRIYRFAPPRYVVIHTRSSRILRPPRGSDVATHVGTVTRCAQLE